MSVVLRDYQVLALDELRKAWAELRRSGVVAPRLLLVSRTGTGKTVIAGEFLRSVVAKGHRANVVVRDRTLIDQTSRHLDRVGITDHGVVAAGHPRCNPAAMVQICSAQTLTARGQRPPADVLVFDEAHGIMCETSQQIALAYPDATILGLTATPERGDGKALGAPYGIFHALVPVRASFDQLVQQGALVDCDVIAPEGGKPTQRLSQDPIDALKKYGPGHRVVIFGRDRAHAAELAAQAEAEGFRAGTVHGESKNRDEHLERIGLPGSDPRAYDVLTNCDLLTQGWDCPAVDTIILARGCSSWSQWMQICGRALRPIPPAQAHLFQKQRALIVDLRGSIYLHGHPGDDHVFSLEGKPVQSAGGSDELPLRYCVKCGATFRYKPACPRCGATQAPPAPPKVAKKDLKLVVRNAPEASRDVKRAYFDGLVAKAKERGWKPKAIGIQFKTMYGHWPPWPVPGGKP